MPGHYVWSPTPDVIERANVTRFMRRHGIADHRELVARSTADIEWFWGAVLEDLDIAFFRPHDADPGREPGDRLVPMVRGWGDQSGIPVPRPACAVVPSRPRGRDLGGRGWLGAAAVLWRAARRDLPPGRGIATPGDRTGRSGRAVPADGARGRHRVPGVREDRSGLDPGLLRLRRRGRRRPAGRRPGRGADHRRRLVPSRQADRAGARRARGRRRLPERPPRHRGAVEEAMRTPRPTTATSIGRRSSRTSRPSVPPSRSTRRLR